MKSAKKAVAKAAVARKKAAAKKKAGVARKAVVRENTGLLVNVRNVGPVVRADFRLKPLTVFVGPNGTGKTFVCKAIHSAIGAMIANPGGELFRRYAKRIQFWVDMLIEEMPTSVRHARMFTTPNAGNAEAQASNFFAELRDRLENMEKIADAVFFEDEFGAQVTASLRRECDELLALYRKNRQMLVKVAQSTPVRERHTSRRFAGKLRSRDIRMQTKRNSPELHITEDDLRGALISAHAKDLWQAISALTKVEWDDKMLTTREGMGNAFYNGIAANFQIAPQNVLGTIKGAAAKINIAGANFTLTPESGSIEFSRNGVHTAQKWSRTLFLDSPVYWKLKSALESARFSHIQRRELDGVPQYFYDLAVLLRKTVLQRKQLVGSNFPDMCQKLEKIIGGKVFINDDTGKLRFQDKRGEYSMHATAGGIVNLGFLSMLIKKDVIDGNTLVFIDEPESNLHPQWQRVMAETLAQLVNAGVHIVIATHSDWMLTAIANIVRRGELGENGKKAALKKDQVGVWLFDRGKKDGGVTTYKLNFGDSGYIPDNLRNLSDDLHNETVELLDAMDERHRVGDLEKAE